MSHMCVCGPLYLAGLVVALDLPHRTVGWDLLVQNARESLSSGDVAGDVLAIAIHTRCFGESMRAPSFA